MNQIIGIILIALIFIVIFLSIKITDSFKTSVIIFFGATIMSAILVLGVFMMTGNLKLF